MLTHRRSPIPPRSQSAGQRSRDRQPGVHVWVCQTHGSKELIRPAAVLRRSGMVMNSHPVYRLPRVVHGYPFTPPQRRSVAGVRSHRGGRSSLWIVLGSTGREETKRPAPARLASRGTGRRKKATVGLGSWLAQDPASRRLSIKDGIHGQLPEVAN